MKKANEQLENRVQEPVEALIQANEKLQVEIASRQWTEAALRTSEAELRALLAAMNDVIVVLDARGRYLKIAPTNPSLLHKPATELIGRTLHEVFDRTQADTFLGCIQQALNKGQTVSAQYSLQIGDRLVWFAASISPMVADTAIWVARDITERKLAEEARVQERNFVSAVLDTAGALVMVLDPLGRIVRFNRACEQTAGHSAEEVIGRHFWELFLLPEEVEPVRAVFENLRSCWLLNQPPLSPNGWPPTPASENLSAIDTKLSNLSAIGRQILPNQPPLSSNGGPPTPASENLSAIDTKLSNLSAIGRQIPQSDSYESHWVAKDGTHRRIAWSNTALLDASGSVKYIICTGTDITERANAEAALRQAKQELEIRVAERTAALKESNDSLVVEIVERIRAEKELRQHQERLEELVRERTAELERANAQLRAEIAERQRINELLFQEKELAQVTLHSIGDAVIATDALGRIALINPAAQRLTGWPAQEALGLPVSQVFQPVSEITRKPVENPVESVLRGNRTGCLTNPSLLTARDGTELAIDESVAPIHGSDGQIVGAVLVFHDVTQERVLARQLSWQASHDALTGLVNRREFEGHLKRAMLQAQTQNQQHALCYLDLDRFKIVNDTCGHVAGDELLRQVSSLLQAGVRKTDTLARLGGDEFAVLLQQCPLEQARRVANSLRESIQAFRFVWQDNTFTIGASIGVVAINAESRCLTNVLNAADAACYAAKEQGRNRVHVYEASDSELAQQHSQMQWVSRITKGFEDNRFRLYLQPVVPVTPRRSNREYDEVLLRLEDETGKLVSPMAFIPAAERYNIMHTIDRWVIRTLFAHLSAVEAELNAGSGERHLTADTQQRLYGINLSGASLNDDQFCDFLHEQFATHQIPPQAICFEITETVALASFSKVGQFIRTFKELGCSFALDDFGSGTSSFAYLKNLPVDYLKIDGSLVKNVVDNPVYVAMIEAINRIGHVMGLETIAEFVENDDILKAIRGLGVDYAQGYGIANPYPLALKE
jgi:diguanylate cyclase (GGDEF)-like protein/PAS domain S-box-containing protein